MTINNIIKLSCNFVNLPELEALVGTTNANEIQTAQLNKLLKCLNLVNEEICSEYFPILKTVPIFTYDGDYYFSSLEEPASAVIYLRDKRGNNIPYKLSNDHISFDGQEGILCYAVMPESLEFGDEIDSIVPERVFAYGIAREFFLMQSLSDEAMIYENRFKESLENIARKKSILRLPKRQWKS